MKPTDSLSCDLVRLLGFLLAPRAPEVLTDRERLAVAALQIRLILGRHTLGIYQEAECEDGDD